MLVQEWACQSAYVHCDPVKPAMKHSAVLGCLEISHFLEAKSFFLFTFKKSNILFVKVMKHTPSTEFHLISSLIFSS